MMSIMQKITHTTVRVKAWITKTIAYCTTGVWNDPRNSKKINAIKVVNLSVRSFLDGDLQSKASALTFSTLLAIVPALALLCAIGRGFGLQDRLMDQLIHQLPSQAQVLETAFGFVDSYLSQASGGIFVGVGVLFLLWTVISLIRNIELTFNKIWQVPKDRSIWRMLTDYLAILLILPILLICASGISIFMSTSLSHLLPFGFMQPAVEIVIDFIGIALSWLFFAGTYMLVPNTNVKFKNAIIPGIIVGTACQILQWLFLSGQLYVAKYNAIYGSFSFLPLFLIWMQLVWLFTLIGGVLCYAIQNIGEYNYGDNIKNISDSYRDQTTIVVMAIIARRFKHSLEPMTLSQISLKYRLPVNLVTPEVLKLQEMGLVNFVDSPGKELNERPVQPAIDIDNLTVSDMIQKLMNFGSTGFIPGFADSYQTVETETEKINQMITAHTDTKRLIDLDIEL